MPINPIIYCLHRAAHSPCVHEDKISPVENSKTHDFLETRTVSRRPAGNSPRLSRDNLRYAAPARLPPSDCGAAVNGKTLVTAGLQRALNTVAAAGGFKNIRVYGIAILGGVGTAFSVNAAPDAPLVKFTLKNIHIDAQHAGNISHTRVWTFQNVTVDARDGLPLKLHDAEQAGANVHRPSESSITPGDALRYARQPASRDGVS